jgi:hypothetical protein
VHVSLFFHHVERKGKSGEIPEKILNRIERYVRHVSHKIEAEKPPIQAEFTL